LGVTIIAASVDDEEKAGEVAAEVSFAVAHSATRADGDAVGAWWEERRGIIQPSEILIGNDSKVVTSSYSSGPLGRMDAEDVVKMVTMYLSRK
jgi:hypothetical protein